MAAMTATNRAEIKALMEQYDIDEHTAELLIEAREGGDIEVDGQPLVRSGRGERFWSALRERAKPSSVTDD
jgi:hypothetical protein